jgi:RNase P/RNase MRP subunit p30
VIPVPIEPSIIPPLHQAATSPIKESLARWITRARSVGYSGFVIDLSIAERVPGLLATIREMASQNAGFGVYTRKTISIEDRASVKSRLSGIRGRSGVDVICVRSSVSEILNFVAKDGRVDSIRLESQPELDAFNDGIASLAGQSGTFIELPFTPLLRTRGASRSKFIRSCNKVLETCGANHARLLVPSDASRLVDVKNAWQKALVLELLLDASKQVAREIVMKNPVALIERCKGKQEDIAMVTDDITEDGGP